MKVKPMVAELIATYFFVLAGVASILAVGLQGGPAGSLGPAIAHGLALMVLVSATMHISGGQLNPAVTIGVWLGNQIPLGQAIANIFAQIVGAIGAVFTLSKCYPEFDLLAIQFGTPEIHSSIGKYAALSLEALFTFVLVMVVFGTAVDKRAPKMSGIFIGFTIMLAGLAIGPATGACINPARYIGPALLASSWGDAMVYIAGPILGAVVGALVYTYGIGRAEQLDEPGEV